MYQAFYGLRELPFELTPDPKFVFLAPQHREALSNLQYGLGSAKALTVLVGEAGTGKTTLLRTALSSDPCRGVHCVYVNNPTLTRDEFVQVLAAKFELSSEAAGSKALFLGELERLLLERRQRHEVTALVVDEAQSLSLELLEEIRLLANVETDSEKLLPLVLAGQPELADRLNDSELRQLKQRVALRCEIAPFGLPETAAYIASRIRTAGGDAARLFTREAVMLIHERSGGIPRIISVMCDNALLSGFALGRRPVGRDIVLEVCRDFDLPGDGLEAAAHQEISDASVPAPDNPPIAAPESAAASDAGMEPENEDRVRRRELFAQVAGSRRSGLFGFARR